VRAVIAESFERIHRSNLVGMGVLPLEFTAGATARSLGLNGTEVFSINGVGDAVAGSVLRVRATDPDGDVTEFDVRCRLDSDTDVDYFRAGGILPLVLEQLTDRTS
jgi:aconitate hydratase